MDEKSNGKFSEHFEIFFGGRNEFVILDKNQNEHTETFMVPQLKIIRKRSMSLLHLKFLTLTKWLIKEETNQVINKTRKRFKNLRFFPKQRYNIYNIYNEQKVNHFINKPLNLLDYNNDR